MKQLKYYLKSIALVTALGAFATSCDKTEEALPSSADQLPLVTFTAHAPTGNGEHTTDTKVSYAEGTDELSVLWATGDAFKLYDQSGTPVSEPNGVFTLSGGSGTSSGTFTGTASDDTYTAFFPSQTPAATWSTLTVDYLNQTQDGDNSRAHLVSKNYMIASGITIANNTSTSNIAFKHLGCVLQFTITMPAGYTVKANGAPVELIITAPGMSSDIKPSAPSATGTLVSTQVLKLKNVTPDGNGKFTAYLMSTPFTIPANGKLSITVACENGSQGKLYGYSHTFGSTGMTYAAGKRYKFALSGATAVSAGEDYVEIGGVKWATGNIVKVAAGQLGFAATANQQGLVFKWGSLIGVNMDGKNDDAFATKAIVFVPNEYTTAHSGTSITAWQGTTGGIPYEDEPTVTDDWGMDKDAFHRLYPTTGYDAAAGKGDICRYMSAQGWLKGKWRMPTSKEFQDMYATTPAQASGFNGNAQGNFESITSDDVNGQKVIPSGWFFGTGAGSGTTSNMSPPPPNSIFFPAGGERSFNSGELGSMGNSGSSWSCSPYKNGNGYYLGFSRFGIVTDCDDSRNSGRPVRCVLE